MTLKVDEVIRQLPENGFNIAQTMRKVGYSPQGCRSGQNYATIRKRLDKYYNPEQIKADILRAEKEFAKDKDNSNRARMIELRAKILGLTKEQPSIGSPVFVGIIEELKTVRCKPIDSNNIAQETQGV